jgi:hypothetical protein
LALLRLIKQVEIGQAIVISRCLIYNSIAGFQSLLKWSIFRHAWSVRLLQNAVPLYLSFFLFCQVAKLIYLFHNRYVLPADSFTKII